MQIHAIPSPHGTLNVKLYEAQSWKTIPKTVTQSGAVFLKIKLKVLMKRETVIEKNKLACATPFLSVPVYF